MKPKDKPFYKKKLLNLNGDLLDISSPKVMGILNITPDSFYSGSRYNDLKTIIEKSKKMLEDGAAILDIGGCSSRPGASSISVKEEYERVIPVIKAIKKEFPSSILSIDTFRAEIAEAAVYEGATIVNDISGGEGDKNMFSVVGKLKVAYILMHMRGTPLNMNQLTEYDNIFKEITLYFQNKIVALKEQNVKDIILDIGIGFAKTIKQNLELLNNMDYFDLLELPMLIGVSRKATIYKTLNITPDHALNGTTVLNSLSITKNINLLRVHDVKEAVETIKLLKPLL